MFACRSGRQDQRRQGRAIRAYERVKILGFKALEAVEKFKTRMIDGRSAMVQGDHLRNYV